MLLIPNRIKRSSKVIKRLITVTSKNLKSLITVLSNEVKVTTSTAAVTFVNIGFVVLYGELKFEIVFG